MLNCSVTLYIPLNNNFLSLKRYNKKFKQQKMQQTTSNKRNVR